MSTTTSTENSGLLSYLLPKFEAKTNSKVQVISVGTGKALELAKNGDVDVTLVHARPSEDKFAAEGYGVNRRAGLALLFASSLQRFEIPALLIGIAAHGWAMFAKSRLEREANVKLPRWTEAAEWVCWVLLTGLWSRTLSIA